MSSLLRTVLGLDWGVVSNLSSVPAGSLKPRKLAVDAGKWRVSFLSLRRFPEGQGAPRCRPGRLLGPCYGPQVSVVGSAHGT